MQIGIIGLPNSGKTTVFNALTGQHAEVGGFTEPGKVHLGVIKVPDPRVDRLSGIFNPRKTTYAEIIFATPERLALLKDYIQSLTQNLDLLQRVDKTEFTNRFREISAWFGPFGEQAMRESTFLVDKLVHRF